MSPRTSATSNTTETVERTSENVRTAAFAAVPTFSGLTGLKKSVTAKEFCRTIDVTLKILRVNSIDALPLAASKLIGEARSWFETEYFGLNSNFDVVTWDMVKEGLQERYADPNEEVLAAGQLISLKQKGKLVKEYTAEFNKLKEYFPGLLEKFLVGLYTHNLQPEIASLVKTNPGNLKSLAAVQNAANLQTLGLPLSEMSLQEENDKIAMKSIANIAQARNFGNGKGGFKKNSFKKFDKSKITCHRCRQKGHFSKECRVELVPVQANVCTDTNPI
ncbi:hypothetical protein HMI54_011279 [Coelomomyces lativittatus]|nr:hypothetical protein HMI56_004888 [Coelomomyces lativittatus]KAJ1499897.1 hypothetical protein HMI54_011279 [Coelomomyces lativittatus]